MNGGKTSPEELVAARRCLAAAEQEALDEVLAIRAQAASLLAAAQQEADQLRATARQEAEQIVAAASSEHTAAMDAIDAARAQLYDDRSRIVAEREALQADQAGLEAEQVALRAEQAALEDERTVIDAMREEVQALQAALEAHRQSAPVRADGSAALATELLEGTQAEMAELSHLLDQLVHRVGDLDSSPPSAHRCR